MRARQERLECFVEAPPTRAEDTPVSTRARSKMPVKAAGRPRAPFLAAEPKIRSKSALAALPFHLVEAARTLRSTHSAAHPLTTKDLQMWVWSAKTWLALQGVVNKQDAPDILSKVGPRAS